MEPRILPTPDASRTQIPPQGEPLVFVVVVVARDAETEFAATIAQLEPSTIPVAYVIVFAPSETATSAHLAAALPSSPLPCRMVRDGDKLRRDTVNFVPNNTSATIHESGIALIRLSSTDCFSQGTNALLSSIARQQNCTTVIVYLGSDRPVAYAAVSRVREAGGFALHAITASRSKGSDVSALIDAYDAVIPANVLATELRRFIEGSLPLRLGRNARMGYSAVQPILTLLRTHLGYDLQGYCLDSISRSIHRRMLLRMKDMSPYYSLLQSSSTELQKLGADVLMPFTGFFRDAESWARLSESVLPRLFNGDADGLIRIWSAGCSTGEEAYSLAMLLTEYQERAKVRLSFVIIGTDIDTGSLLSARAGLYSHAIDQELSPERIKRFFRIEEGGYRVVPELRELCVFSVHHLCFDTPLANIDLLVCRHTIRYFGRTLQEQAFANIHHALSGRGVCMLAEADVAEDRQHRLTPLDAGHQLYSRLNLTTVDSRTQTQLLTSSEPEAQAKPAAPADGVQSALEIWVALQRCADNLVAARFGPPGIIVDSELTVVEIRGELAPFVHISPGLVSKKLQQLVKPAVADKVAELVRGAPSGNTPLLAHCVVAPSAERVAVEVVPLPTGSHSDQFFLVLLQLTPRPLRSADPHVALLDAAATTGATGRAAVSGFAPPHRPVDLTWYDPSITEGSYQRNAQQQQRSRLEDRNTPGATTNDASQANQQEPSRADRPSEPEQEPRQRPSAERTENALGDTGAQGAELIAGAGIPLLVLNKEFVIVHVSPAGADILGLSTADVGKLLTDFDLHLHDLGPLEPLLLKVLQTRHAHEQEVQNRQQHWFRIVIRPHQVANETVGLIVMFVDIDTERTLLHQLTQARDFAARVLQQIPSPVAVLHADLTFRLANEAFQNLTGTAAQELEGWSLHDFTQRVWGLSADSIELHKLEALPIGGLIETEFTTRSAQRQTLLLKGQALLNGTSRLLLLLAEDVTLQRETDRVLARQQTALADQLADRDTLLKVTQKELHELAQHLFTVQEQERERIASELHDDVSQRLSLLQMACSRLAQLPHPPAETLEIRGILEQVQSLATDVRAMSHNLHPALLKQLGLVVALKALVDDFREREHLQATLTSTIGALRPSDLASTTCYRVVQEALRNVAKHAGRTNVKVSLDCVDERLRLQVRDFGRGFDQSSHFRQPGLGLTSMRERTRIAGGSFSIVSTPGEGTVIIVDVPAGVNG